MNKYLYTKTLPGITLDLFCANCEHFILMVVSPSDKVVCNIKCNDCGEHLLLIQICDAKSAIEVSQTT